MLILGIDSAASACNACVWRDGKVLALAAEQMERGQDRRLMPMIVETIQQAGVDFPALDRIAVTRGPGSFTGLRIGLAAARGIGLAANKPVIGIDRFLVYREQFKTRPGNLLAIIDSKRQELFCRFYPANGQATEATMMMPDEIEKFLSENKNTVVAGDATLPSNIAILKPAENEIVTTAALAARAIPDHPDFLPRPLYIRPPDVTFASRKAG